MAFGILWVVVLAFLFGGFCVWALPLVFAFFACVMLSGCGGFLLFGVLGGFFLAFRLLRFAFGFLVFFFVLLLVRVFGLCLLRFVQFLPLSAFRAGYCWFSCFPRVVLSACGEFVSVFVLLACCPLLVVFGVCVCFLAVCGVFGVAGFFFLASLGGFFVLIVLVFSVFRLCFFASWVVWLVCFCFFLFLGFLLVVLLLWGCSCGFGCFLVFCWSWFFFWRAFCGS